MTHVFLASLGWWLTILLIIVVYRLIEKYLLHKKIIAADKKIIEAQEKYIATINQILETQEKYIASLKATTYSAVDAMRLQSSLIDEMSLILENK